MIAERSAPGLKEPDVARCLNCGSIVIGAPNAGPEADHGSGIDRPRRPPVSPLDQFVIRQNIAIYERQLARESDPAGRAVLRRLLDAERAKQAPPAERPQIPD